MSIASCYKPLLLLANCVDAALGPLLANVPHVHRLGLRGLSGSSTGLKRRWRRWISQASGCASDIPGGNCHIGPFPSLKAIMSRASWRVGGPKDEQTIGKNDKKTDANMLRLRLVAASLGRRPQSSNSSQSEQPGICQWLKRNGTLLSSVFRLENKRVPIIPEAAILCFPLGPLFPRDHLFSLALRPQRGGSGVRPRTRLGSGWQRLLRCSMF